MKPLIDVVPKYVNHAKEGKKYGSIKLADDTKYLVPAAMVKQLHQNVATKISFHKEEWKDGPVEIVDFVAPNGNAAPKQFTRAAANPQDSDRMGTMGMVNAALSGICQGSSLTDVLAAPTKAYADLIDKFSDALHTSKLHGKQAQTRDDLEDEIPY